MDITDCPFSFIKFVFTSKLMGKIQIDCGLKQMTIYLYKLMVFINPYITHICLIH